MLFIKLRRRIDAMNTCEPIRWRSLLERSTIRAEFGLRQYWSGLRIWRTFRARMERETIIEIAGKSLSARFLAWLIWASGISKFLFFPMIQAVESCAKGGSKVLAKVTRLYIDDVSRRVNRVSTPNLISSVRIMSKSLVWKKLVGFSEWNGLTGEGRTVAWAELCEMAVSAAADGWAFRKTSMLAPSGWIRPGQYISKRPIKDEAMSIESSKQHTIPSAFVRR